MRVRFLQEAAAELDEASDWLEAEAGLGETFLACVSDALARILRFPYLAQAAGLPGTGPDLRRAVVGRFRYSLLYRVRADELVIVAVAHMRREPGYWRDRLAGEE